MRARWALRGLMLVAASLIPLSTAATADALTPGQIVVVDGNAYGGCVSGCGGLMMVDPATGAETQLSANTMAINATSQLFNAPFALVFDATGDIISINTFGMGGSCKHGCGGVIRIDPVTGKESVVSSNDMPINASSQYFSEPTGVTIDAAGNILVADWGHCVGCGEVIKVDPVTGKQTLISSNNMPVNASSKLFVYVQGLALDHAGNIVIANASASASQPGDILEVDPNTGRERELSGNEMPVNASSQYLFAPVNLVVDAAGSILVADWGHCSGSCGGVVKIDPATGKETLLSANSLAVNASSQYFAGPTGIALDAHGNIIVADEYAFGPCTSTSCGGVIEVDPTTGKEAPLSSNDMPVNSSNQLFVQPFDVAVVPSPVDTGPTAPPGAGGGSPPTAPPGAGGGSPPGSTPPSSHGQPGSSSPSAASGHARFATKLVRVAIQRWRRTASFGFTSVGEARRVVFICKLDRGRASRCTSPRTYRRLARGHHTFTVYALGLAHGNRHDRSEAAVAHFLIGQLIRPVTQASMSG